MSGGTVKHAYEQGEKVGDYVVHLDGWTTDPPTQGGWYWAWKKESGKYPDIVNVIMVASLGEYFADTIPRNDASATHPLDYFSHWLGPIPQPEPPQ